MTALSPVPQPPPLLTEEPDETGPWPASVQPPPPVDADEHGVAMGDDDGDQERERPFRPHDFLPGVFGLVVVALLGCSGSSPVAPAPEPEPVLDPIVGLWQNTGPFRLPQGIGTRRTLLHLMPDSTFSLWQELTEVSIPHIATGAMWTSSGLWQWHDDTHRDELLLLRQEGRARRLIAPDLGDWEPLGMRIVPLRVRLIGDVAELGGRLYIRAAPVK